MTSFLSVVEVGMVRDELTRLQHPNAPDQLQLLRAMCEALKANNHGAFTTAWKGLEVGFGVRLTLNDFLFYRLGTVDEQFSPEQGGTAKPKDAEELIPEVKNTLQELTDRLGAIAPEQPRQSAAPVRTNG